MRRQLAILLALTVLAASCSDDSVESTAPPATTRPVAASPRPVTFATPDGLTLEGTLFGEGGNSIILAHMRPADQTSWFSFAEELAEAGYTALTFNFRGYGSSDDGSLNDIDRDIVAAAAFLRGQRSGPVVVIGASMGGTAAVAAAEAIEAAGVVALSAPDEFQGIDALGAMATLPVPGVFAAAENDGDYGVIAESLYTASQSGSSLLVFSGRAHGSDLFEDNGLVLSHSILEFLGEVFA